MKMTIKQAFEKFGVGKVFAASPYDRGTEFECTFIDSAHVCSLPLGSPNLSYIVENIVPDMTIFIVDWIEENTNIGTGICKCEWMSVLAYGCSCGAIVRYSERNKT